LKKSSARSNMERVQSAPRAIELRVHGVGRSSGVMMLHEEPDLALMLA